MTADVAAAPEKEARLGPRLNVVSAALGFACGLPYSFLLGSVAIWFTNAGLSFSQIGALSWIGLFYAFKFIWSPAWDWIVPPFANTVGRRKAWIAICQIVIVACIFGMALINPRDNILIFALFAVVAGFFSASQDTVVDAWRIQTAESPRALDKITVNYQLGYRMAAILAGAVALLLADLWATPTDAAAGWPLITAMVGVLMATALIGTFAAPEPLLAPPPAASEPMAAPEPEDQRRLRGRAALAVAIGWAGAGLALLGFMFYTLANPGASAAAFRDAATPWILLVTVGAPIAVSYWLVRKPGLLPEAPLAASARFLDVLFERVLAPLADLVRRYWLWALPILALAMTYRIADSIWGSFAGPFYIRILEASNSDVAVASKMVGVVMTMAGIALGGLGVAKLGRLPALLIGAILASATNLLYADLAHGARFTDAFLAFTHLGPLFDWLVRGFVGLFAGAAIFDGVQLGPPLVRLTAVIAMENLAGGFASCVHLVWLSSIVNKRYATVQYALLASLSMLIGVIFRPAIGSYVDRVKDAGLPAQAEQFADVFIFAAWIGLLAVALVAAEMWRARRAAAAA